MGFLRKHVFPFLYGILLFPLVSLFLPKIKVLSSLETIQKLKKMEHLSLVRFGDGEFDLMSGCRGPYYQRGGGELLSSRLREVFASNNENLLLAVPQFLSVDSLPKNLARSAFLFWRMYIVRRFFLLKKHLRTNITYGDALLSRPYISRLDAVYASQIFTEIRSLWEAKSVVIIEGEKTRFGVGNNLLNNAKSIKRIIAPAENAFSRYSEILTTAKQQKPGTIFVVALGPAAKLLALDLCSDYRVLDLGHLDIEYEWYLRGYTKKGAIPNKYVNESKQIYIEDGHFDSTIYQSQIIARID